MMFALFKWGFVLAMGLTWLAMVVSALMLLIPVKPEARRPARTLEGKRAA